MNEIGIYLIKLIVWFCDDFLSQKSFYVLQTYNIGIKSVRVWNNLYF